MDDEEGGGGGDELARKRAKRHETIAERNQRKDTIIKDVDCEQKGDQRPKHQLAASSFMVHITPQIPKGNESIGRKPKKRSCKKQVQEHIHRRLQLKQEKEKQASSSNQRKGKQQEFNGTLSKKKRMRGKRGGRKRRHHMNKKSGRTEFLPHRPTAVKVVKQSHLEEDEEVADQDHSYISRAIGKRTNIVYVYGGIPRDGCARTVHMHRPIIHGFTAGVGSVLPSYSTAFSRIYTDRQTAIRANLFMAVERGFQRKQEEEMARKMRKEVLLSKKLKKHAGGIRPNGAGSDPDNRCDDDEDEDDDVYGPRVVELPSEVRAMIKLFKQNSRQQWEEELIGDAVLKNTPDYPFTIESGSVSRTFKLKDCSNFTTQHNALTWVDGDQVSFAATFEDEQIALEFVNIISLEHTVSDMGSGDGSEEEGNVEPLELPEISIATMQTYKDFSEELFNTRTNLLQAQTIPARSELTKVLKQFSHHVFTHIDSFFDTFEKVDDMEMEEWQQVFCGMATLICLSCDTSTFEMCIAEKRLDFFIGMFEHSSDHGTTYHRDHLDSDTRLIEIVPIKHPSMKTLIKQTYFVTYLKDVVLAGLIDDYMPSFLDQQVMSLSQNVLDVLFGDRTYIEAVMDVSSLSADSDKIKKQAKFLVEIFSSTGLAFATAPAKFKVLAESGMYDLIDLCLRSKDGDVRRDAASAVLKAIDTSREYVQLMMKNGWNLLASVSRAFVNESNIGTIALLVSCLRNVLEFDERDDVIVSSRLLSDFFDSDVCFNNIVSLFWKPTEDMRNSRALREKLVYVLELVSDWIPVHEHHIRRIILRKKLLRQFSLITKARNSLLNLGLARCFSKIIKHRNEVLISNIIKQDCLRSLFEVFEKNKKRNNMINSTFLDLISYIAVENIARLRDYLAENFREILSSIEHHDCGEKLLLRYEQRMDENVPPQTTILTAQRFDRYNVQEGLSASEESFFNEEDDVDELNPTNKVSPPTSTLVTPPPTIISRLVDYDDEDDEDEDFLSGAALATKKPKVQFKISSKFS
eukprot:m.96690 g.96690  ORF g.96690 m.96690 type:complete len:1029 (+) comp8971_c3_seq1:143-3229(+)